MAFTFMQREYVIYRRQHPDCTPEEAAKAVGYPQPKKAIKHLNNNPFVNAAIHAKRKRYDPKHAVMDKVSMLEDLKDHADYCLEEGPIYDEDSKKVIGYKKIDSQNYLATMNLIAKMQAFVLNRVAHEGGETPIKVKADMHPTIRDKINEIYDED
jgi:hypothetical protein